jgi:hypothetical protein
MSIFLSISFGLVASITIAELIYHINNRHS